MHHTRREGRLAGGYRSQWPEAKLIRVHEIAEAAAILQSSGAPPVKAAATDAVAYYKQFGRQAREFHRNCAVIADGFVVDERCCFSCLVGEPRALRPDSARWRSTLTRPSSAPTPVSARGRCSMTSSSTSRGSGPPMSGATLSSAISRARGPRGCSEGGCTAAAHWLPTRPPSTGAAAEILSVRRTETAGFGAVPRSYPVGG